MKLPKIILLTNIFFFSLISPAFAATTISEKAGFAQLSDLVTVFANLVSVVASLAGFALLIVIIRGGISYITAQGDPKAVMAARSSLTWGVIGFIVIIAAFVILTILIGFVEVPGLGKFCIPTPGKDAATACK